MTAAIDQIKTWAAPLLMTALVGTCLYIFNEQRHRITALELQVASSNSTIATIAESQRNSAADRADFQSATTARLDRMQDVLTKIGENLAALTAIQQHK